MVMPTLGSDLIDLAQVLSWLAAYTYPAVFLATLIDASGVPFPGRLLLIAAGAVAAASDRSVVLVIALAALAAMVMDHLWYLAATRGSRWLLQLHRRLSHSREGDVPGRADTARYGPAAIVLGRFFLSLRVVAWPLIAAHGLGHARFFALDLVGASLWASTWVLLGWVVGGQWRAVAETTGPWLAVTGAAVFGLAASVIAIRARRRLWRKRPVTARPPRPPQA
jgi:membrane protein DedA with SNARE-associated domain